MPRRRRHGEPHSLSSRAARARQSAVNAHATSDGDTTHDARRRLVAEAIEIVAPDRDAETMIDGALVLAGRIVIPTIAEGLRVFLSGHLLDVIESQAGPDASDQFEDSIELLVRAAAALHESAPAPKRGDHGRVVLVASSDPQRIALIAKALSKHADVEPVEDPESLAALVWAELASAVVIDWMRCPLDVMAIDELAASVSEGGRLVLWGAPPEVEERFLEAKRATWLSCARTAPPSHVAGIVLALLEID
ncbi:MAG: hypothetical protein M3Y87_03265 [Myxococcota bacterium]|nr:hypothetical protein [Myxococcota bacterium]